LAIEVLLAVVLLNNMVISIMIEVLLNPVVLFAEVLLQPDELFADVLFESLVLFANVQAMDST
jgi:hypothetical protein